MSNQTIVAAVTTNGATRSTLTLRNLGALLLLAVMWGLSIPITKLGLQTLPPLTLTAMRFGVAVPLLLMFVIVGKHSMPWRALPRVAALGVLGIGIGQVSQTFGVAGTSASVGTIISATIPIFIVFFAALRLRQPVSGLQQLGLLAAFAGIALVALGHEGATTSAQTTAGGATWVLLSALAIAFYYVWSVELTTAYGTATVAAWSTLFGFIALIPWTARELWDISSFHVTAQGFLAAVYLGVVVTVAGLFIWLSLLRVVPARVAASVQYLQPVVGVVAASAMFGDRIGATFVLGVALVLAGLALSMTSHRPARK
ncbi:DMT family transporter [Paraburkholderia dipogonis]|uniref:DMT family transporter n=1 Tax=Paraburkholderia dipogonis TaxID=1211383 RepID=A0A4Y8MS85_9BURK|nr:DMT family transporter [Paraburkholderia dipogonis]TFE40321.1 DMT family transporter [Paraburkholderia dipogonis]